MPKTWPNQIHSVSIVMPGIIEDIDICRITEFGIFHRSETEFKGLSESIQQNGLLQPILVRPRENCYEIVAGHRRFFACRSLGWKKIACHVIELDDKSAFEITLIENVHRKTLNPLEEAQAFKFYISDFGWGRISDLSAKIGKSKSYITKRLKLLNLPPDILQSIVNHKIDVSIAEELFQVKDQNRQSLLANLVISRRLSMRTTRKLISEDENCRTILADYQTVYTNHIRLGELSFDKS